MNYELYLKKEIEKSMFIETNKDLIVNIKGNPILKKGEYPLMPQDVVSFAQRGIEGVPADAIINGMLYIIACDPAFKYNDKYIEFLKSIEGIEDYIIMNIEKNKASDLKKALIFSTALLAVRPDKKYSMNRCYLLMELYEKSGMEAISTEIIKSLEGIIAEYPDFAEPSYYLGEYYAEKDLDKSKFYLRKCMNDPKIYEKASELLEKIHSIENYDDAVDMVKAGNGQEALKTLIPYTENHPQNLDAKYYTAVAYRQAGDPYRALDYLDNLLNYGETLEVYSEIALNLAALNDFESALGYFKKALKIMPDDSGIICNIGVCHLSLGQTVEAKHAFELAYRINPKDEIAKEWLKKIE